MAKKNSNLKFIGTPPNDVEIIDANDGELVAWISSDFWETISGDNEPQDLVSAESPV